MKSTQFFSATIVFAIAGLTTAQAQANILNVCQSGCSYSLPSQAYNAAVDGDTIQIQPGTYTDCIYIQKNNLTITGVNGMPKMVNQVCGQKGILVTAGQNITIKNLELSGATNNDNYAGIRHDAAGFNLTLDNVYIHDNDDGILGSSSGDTITITNSKFQNNGMNSGNGYAHNLYIGNAALVTFSNSQSLSAKLQGHEFKSRSARLEIYSSTIASLGSNDSRLIDYSNGGTLIVQNSVLEKGSSSANNEMIAFAPEGLGSNRSFSVTLTGNQIIGDRNPTDLIYYYNVTPSMNISGNILVAIRTITNAGSAGSNTIYSSRSAAGYAAYPWLPAAGGTTTTTSPSTTTTTVAPTTTTTTLASSSSWVRCANEGGVCSFSGTRTVRYGANGSYYTKVATSSINCDNATFGDPASGVVKACDYSSSTVTTATTTTTLAPTTTTTLASSTSWVRCASEGGVCSFSGTRTVRYGANGSYYTKVATSSITCDNATFGDPAYGVAKACDYSSSTSTSTSTTTVTTTTSSSYTYKVRTRVNNAYCADDPSATNGTQLHLWQCLSNLSNQSMTFTSAGEIRVNGKCVDATQGRSGDPIVVNDCNGSAAQKWTYNSSTGELKGVNGLCFDAWGGQAANGTNIGLWTCNGGNNQKWDLTAP